MKGLASIWDNRALLPAGLAVGAVAAVWLLVRLAIAPRAGGAEPGAAMPLLVIGALLLTLLLCTLAAVAWAAAVRPREPHAGARTWLGFAALADAAAVWLIVLAWDSRQLGVGDVLRIYVLLAAWLAMWTAIAAWLRRRGPGFAVAVAGTLAVALLALPVAITPVYRALSPEQAASLTPTVAYACPALGIIEAASGSIPFQWPQQRVMYGLTPLGQDYPLPLPTWWVQAAVFGGVALALAGLERPLGRR